MLKLYKYPVEEEDQESVNSISVIWNELLDVANRKDHEVSDYKKTFA